MKVKIIGGGLAGTEAAWQLAKRGFEVVIYEQRPVKKTPVHKTDYLAELVCSNSLRSEEVTSGAGLLKEEMRRLNSIILQVAEECRLPGGKALVVDRLCLAKKVTERLLSTGRVEIVRMEVKEVLAGPAIICTGPLTEGDFADSLRKLIGHDFLFFYDAVSPIVSGDSIDYSKTFWGARWQEEEDYLNCPMNRQEYEVFWEALVNAKTVPVPEHEKNIFFEGCLPIEELARRGKETLAFGPLRPVGFKNLPEGTYAVVQLRREDMKGEAFSLVGFQTRLLWSEQERVFRLIPALRKAEFLRYGVIHRNSYILGPKVLEPTLRVKNYSDLFMAGQITGVEGYVESAASGIVAGINMARLLMGKDLIVFPPETMIGALMFYVSLSNPKKFLPMNANFGLLLPVKARGKFKKKIIKAKRALKRLEKFIEEKQLLHNWS